jgi:hypothetical protein
LIIAPSKPFLVTAARQSRKTDCQARFDKRADQYITVVHAKSLTHRQAFETNLIPVISSVNNGILNAGFADTTHCAKFQGKNPAIRQLHYDVITRRQSADETIQYA